MYLTAFKVKELVDHTSRDITPDSEVLEAVLKWISKNETGRKVYIYDLLQNINFGTILKTCPELLVSKLLSENPNCTQLLWRAALEENVITRTPLTNGHMPVGVGSPNDSHHMNASINNRSSSPQSARRSSDASPGKFLSAYNSNLQGFDETPRASSSRNVLGKRLHAEG